MKIEGRYFICMFNGYKSECFGSSLTDVHGIGSCFVIAWRPSTFFMAPLIDMVISDVSDLCKVRVGCPIARSDHSHVGIVIDLSLGAPGIDFYPGGCFEVKSELASYSFICCTDALGCHCSQCCYG